MDEPIRDQRLSARFRDAPLAWNEQLVSRALRQQCDRQT